MKRQSVKFPWDLYWENETYKLQRYIESKRNMFSYITEHPERGGYPGKLRPEVYPLTLLYTTVFLIEKVLLSYIFRWQMLPFSQTSLRTLHSLNCLVWQAKLIPRFSLVLLLLLFHFDFYFHFIIKMFCIVLKINKMNLFPVQ